MPLMLDIIPRSPPTLLPNVREATMTYSGLGCGLTQARTRLASLHSRFAPREIIPAVSRSASLGPGLRYRPPPTMSRQSPDRTETGS